MLSYPGLSNVHPDDQGWSINGRGESEAGTDIEVMTTLESAQVQEMEKAEVIVP